MTGLLDFATRQVVAEQRPDGLFDVVLRVVIDGGYVSPDEVEDEAAAWRIELSTNGIGRLCG